MRASLLGLMLMLGCDDPTIDGTLLDGADADTDADADADSDADADTDSDADTDVGCEAPKDGTDAWKGHPIADAGAAVTFTPYKFDAGVGAVRDAAVKAGTTFTDAKLPVTNAIVTARGFVFADPFFVELWIADQSGPMRVYIDVPDPDDGSRDKEVEAIRPLAPGDQISFTATQVVHFGTLTPEIVAFENLTVTSSGNDVWVIDGNSGDVLTYADHGEAVINVYGKLISNPTDCSGASCYDFQYATGQTIEYRTRSNYDMKGDCLHFIGPMIPHEGVGQLEVDDFDWDRWY